VQDSANLSLARKQVKVNKGAPGIEGKQGVPELREIWIRLHYGANPKLAETAQSEDELRQAVAFPAARGPICGS
jgi:hypothetical protein